MFRWIAYADHEPAFNMAVDEAILEAHRAGLVPATLRFYGWSPPAVSTGYAQKLPYETMARIRSKGYALVRRATGGRAVLHEADLTYSFIGCSGSCDDIAQSIGPTHLSNSVSQSYFQICQGLLAGLKILGVDAGLGKGKGYTGFQDCFLSTTNADLQVDGLKLVGSAQLRRQNAVLQHGSILLNQDQNALPDLLQPAVSAGVQQASVAQQARVVRQPSVVHKANVFNTAESDKDHASLESDVTNYEALQPQPRPNNFGTPKDALSMRHKNLFELTGVLPIATIERAFVEGFAAAFGEQLQLGELTGYELELAHSLREKFSYSEDTR
jgi:lipoate-protein ligase A